MIEPLVRELAPSLLERTGFGIENTAQLLVTCGDNPERVTDEARFAKLCGVAPLPASSGKVQRHRLNRGGDRQANSALHMAVVCRLHYDEATQKYLERRTSEGKSKMEIRAGDLPMDHLVQRRTPPLRTRLRTARRVRGSLLAEPGANPAVRLKQDHRTLRNSGQLTRW